MTKIKKKKEKKKISIEEKKFRLFLMGIFVVIASIGIILGIMTWFDIISPYWFDESNN